MLILALSNIVVAFIIAVFDMRYLYSFEISFVCSVLIFFSSFKSMQKKVHMMAGLSKADSSDDDIAISKKEKFFIGTRISFGLFRILSYIFLGFCIVGLINNELFFIIPFIAGTATSSVALALYLAKKHNL